MEKVLVIVGPTGIGKSNLAIELATQFNGEIINADSLQVYKHLDIGTAKATKEEQQGVSHHLIDIKELDESYTVYDYQKDARIKITQITNKGKLPIIVGGTGLYIKACLYNYEFTEESKNKETYDKVDTASLYNKLLKLDPNTTIHSNNRIRIIRALNYQSENSLNIEEKPKSDKLLYDAVIIGLTIDRNTLYQRIDNRVDQMFDNGLLTEVNALYDANIKTKPITTGIGYKELYQYLDNTISLTEANDLIKQNSRRYAKRQYTFFNNQLPVKWFDIKEDKEIIIDYIKKEL